MGAFGLPDGVREQMKPIMEEAMIMARDEVTLEINRGEAARTAVGLMFEKMRPEMGELMYKSVEYMVGYELNNTITKSKEKAIKGFLRTGAESDEEVKDKCYKELVSYRVRGQQEAVTKFLGDCTVEELEKVISDHRKRYIVLGRKTTRYRELVKRMKAHGANSDQKIAEYFYYEVHAVN